MRILLAEDDLKLGKLILHMLKNKKLLMIGAVMLALTAFQGAAVYADHDGDHESHEERQWKESYNTNGEYQKEDYEEGKYDDDFRYSSGQTDGTYPGSAGYNQGTSAQAVLLDGQPVSFRFPGSMLQTDMIIAVGQGEVLVPAEVVLDGLQIPYVIYSKGDILELFAGGHHVIFHTDKNTIYVDGLKSFLPAAPFYRNALYYIPIHVLADVIGDKLEWNPDKNLLQMRKGG